MCRRVARRYPPAIYSDDGRWTDEAVDDLAQEVTLERLLGESQLDYVLELATDDDSLSRLLAFQVRRVLAHRRTTTVVDRLMNRIDARLTEEGFSIIELGGDRFVRPSDGGVDPRPLTDHQIRRIVARVAEIPRIPSNPTGKRESMVYNQAGLRALVAILMTETEGLLRSDIRRILEISLTAWLPTVLREGEENSLAHSDPEIDLQRSTVPDLVNNVIAALDDVQRAVLLGKSQDLSDGELARQLGRSRPWIADRKVEVLEIVERQLIAELPEELHGAATRTLLDELARLHEEPS